MPAALKDVNSGNAFTLEDFNLIGRSEGVTIHLADSGISRQHATIRREGMNYWLVDLGSANGTYVNDVALTAPRVLRDGDRLQFGRSVLLFDQDEPTQRQRTVIADGKTQISKTATLPMRHQSLTLFVGDLAGFTYLSSQLSPDQVAELLREWYGDCNAILKHYGASVDKFIGDCVFAYWHGTELDIRAKALHAAQALRAVEIDSTSPTRVLLRDLKNVVLDCRIGLHVGDVAIGSMGKGINTALGDAVNVAFRIEALTRKVDKPALVSSAFLEGWDEGRSYFESCGFHEVKGQKEMIEVFSLRQ
jgi:adenylate cyclase